MHEKRFSTYRGTFVQGKTFAAGATPQGTTTNPGPQGRVGGSGHSQAASPGGDPPFSAVLSTATAVAPRSVGTWQPGLQRVRRFSSHGPTPRHGPGADPRRDRATARGL